LYIYICVYIYTSVCMIMWSGGYFMYVLMCVGVLLINALVCEIKCVCVESECMCMGVLCVCVRARVCLVCVNGYMYVYTCVCIDVCHVCVCICGCVYVCTSVWLGVCVYLWESVCISCNTRTRSCDPNSITEDSDFCPLWTRYTSDLKIDPRDDSEIRAGSYSENQTAIRAQNRIISYECSFVTLLRISVFFRVSVYLIGTFLLLFKFSHACLVLFKLYLIYWLPSMFNCYTHTLILVYVHLYTY